MCNSLTYNGNSMHGQTLMGTGGLVVSSLPIEDVLASYTYVHGHHVHDSCLIQMTFCSECYKHKSCRVHLLSLLCSQALYSLHGPVVRSFHDPSMI